MTVAVADNPAVTDPHRTLTPGQRDALLSIGFYRNHRRSGGQWLIGTKRFATNTVNTLQKLQLVAPPPAPGQPLRLTLAGRLAIDKLKGDKT